MSDNITQSALYPLPELIEALRLEADEQIEEGHTTMGLQLHEAADLIDEHVPENERLRIENAKIEHLERENFEMRSRFAFDTKTEYLDELLGIKRRLMHGMSHGWKGVSVGSSAQVFLRWILTGEGNNE